MSAKDRVRTAAEATTASVRQIRPLTLPDSSAVSADLREHRGCNVPRVSGTLMKIKETWMIPLGAAALVAALALSLVTLRHAEAPRPAPTKASTVAPAVAGIPQYFALATEEITSPNGPKAAIDVTVGDVRTGKTLATVALPAVDVTVGVNSAVGVSAAGDDRTFVVARRDVWGDVAYFLVHIAPGTKQVATVKQLPIPEVNLPAVLGIAVSPNGKELAVLSAAHTGTTLRIYSTRSGATVRTWVAATWKTANSAWQQGVNVSWTADNRQVAFTELVATGSNPYFGVLAERLIGATEPSGDLVTASKVVFKAPANCTSLLLTPDGRTVVCATWTNEPGVTAPAGCGKNGPMFVAYSAATGKRLRVLYQYTEACDYAEDTVLWSDDSVQHVIGESQTTLQGNPPQSTNRYGVAAAGEFTKFPVPQLGEWYSGPTF
jgi:hypothetical protein